MFIKKNKDKYKITYIFLKKLKIISKLLNINYFFKNL